MTTRKIKKLTTGQRTIDGAGVHLVRVLGHDTVMDYDPFLMLDSFDSHNPTDYIKGFPIHPHRGIETISYLVQGEMTHQDSLGNKGTIRSGESQWMTAGSGIMHQEMPQASKHMLGVQLWLNLPQKEKMTDPTYFDITGNMIGSKKTDNAIIHVLDHCSIFLLILGSYVPICIVLLPPELGWKLLGINLLLTVVGITLNAISLSRWEKLSLLMYVLMGWSVIIALPYLWKMLPADGLMLLVSGGLAYTIGIFFYADKKHKFMHSVWHLFVMTGSVLHYFFVLYFIL